MRLFLLMAVLFDLVGPQSFGAYRRTSRISDACEKYLSRVDELGELIQEAQRKSSQSIRDVELAQKMRQSIRAIQRNAYHGKPGAYYTDSAADTVQNARRFAALVEIGEPEKVAAPRVREPRKKIEVFERKVSAVFSGTELFGDFTPSQTGIEKVYVAAVRSDLYGDGQLMDNWTHWLVRFQVVVDPKDERFDGLLGTFRGVIGKPSLVSESERKAYWAQTKGLRDEMESIPLQDIPADRVAITYDLLFFKNIPLVDLDSGYFDWVFISSLLSADESLDNKLAFLKFVMSDSGQRIVAPVIGGDRRYKR